MRDPDDPDEWEILLGLAAIAAGQGAVTDLDAFDDLIAATVAQQVTSSPGSPVNGRDPDQLLAAVAHRRGPERLLDLLLRSGPYGDHFADDGDGLSLDLLLEHPHGIDLGPLQPRIPEIVNTRSGSIELAPDVLLDDLAETATAFEGQPAQLLLVGRRHLRTNNSWMHNVPMLAKGRDLCTLQIHPDDAEVHGLTDAGNAQVTSATGSIVVPVETTEDITPGVVSVPHGFGHDLDGTRLDVAGQQPGSNANVLSSEHDIDPVSGTAVLNGIPVDVQHAP